MSFGIAFKLLLAILLSCLVVTLAMGLAVRYSFDSGFDAYVQQREARRMQSLAQSLAADYAQAGSWAFLAQDRGNWWRNLRDARDAHEDDRAGFSGFPRRVTLVDAQGERLAGVRLPTGRAQAELHRYPVQVEGRTVGWLLSPPPVLHGLSDEVDQRFQRRQLHATWMIVGLSFLLAVVVSWFLSRLLLVPVRRITQATHRLASGQYDTRVRVRSADELGRLARDFNRLAHSLSRNRRLRHELMADISHELRTPLAVLRGEIEALQDKLRPCDDAALASLAHEVGRLNQLIDDLYALSLADTGALDYHFEPLDFVRLVRDAVAGARPRFERAGLALQLEAARTEPVAGDAQRLNQLLANLLENSLRYTDAPGTVRLRVWSADGRAHLSVADSAPGVDLQRLRHLFERLYRAEPSRSRKSGGAGLGLALCHSIVQAHGGTIEARTSELGGLEIVASLPLQPRAEG